MSDLRIANRPVATNTPKPGAAQTKPAGKPTAIGGDTLVMTRARVEAAQALAVLNDAAQLPMAGADHDAWLQDGYARLAKAEVSLRALQEAPKVAGVSSETLSAATFKVMDLQRALHDADPDRAGEKKYYTGLASDATAVIDDLARIPPAAKDRAGMQAWLAKNEPVLKKAEAARQVIDDAWMHEAFDFDKLGKVDEQLMNFEGRVDAVRDRLNPPKPRPAGKADPNDPFRPLFGATQGVEGMLDKSQDPVTSTVGAVALPFALLFDTLDLITRPFQALDRLQQKDK